MLGSLDENEPEGEPGDYDEEGDDEEDEEGGLDSKLQNIKVEEE